jgi:hypothetical protein
VKKIINLTFVIIALLTLTSCASSKTKDSRQESDPKTSHAKSSSSSPKDNGVIPNLTQIQISDVLKKQFSNVNFDSEEQVYTGAFPFKVLITQSSVGIQKVKLEGKYTLECREGMYQFASGLFKALNLDDQLDKLDKLKQPIPKKEEAEVEDTYTIPSAGIKIDYYGDTQQNSFDLILSSLI